MKDWDTAVKQIKAFDEWLRALTFYSYGSYSVEIKRITAEEFSLLKREAKTADATEIEAFLFAQNAIWTLKDLEELASSGRGIAPAIEDIRKRGWKIDDYDSIYQGYQKALDSIFRNATNIWRIDSKNEAEYVLQHSNERLHFRIYSNVHVD